MYGTSESKLTEAFTMCMYLFMSVFVTVAHVYLDLLVVLHTLFCAMLRDGKL